MYGVSIEVTAVEIEANRRFSSSGRATAGRPVSSGRSRRCRAIRHSSTSPRPDSPATGTISIKYVADSTQGFSLMLAGLKAFLEHGVKLNLTADRFPEGIDHG